MKTFVYTGPCQSCSLGKSKKTGTHIMVRSGQEFRVHEEDVDWLKSKYGKLLAEPEAQTPPRRTASETNVKPADDD